MSSLSEMAAALAAAVRAMPLGQPDPSLPADVDALIYADLTREQGGASSCR